MKKTVAVAASALMLLMSALPTFAEVTMYGRVLMETFYVDAEGTDGVRAGVSRVANTADTTDLRFALQSNSRLGGKFKVSDEVTGLVELGLGSSVSLRHAYGIYHFGGGTLLVGQTDFPADWGPGNVTSIDQGMNGFGQIGVDRMPQITVNLTNGIYVSLLKNLNGSGHDVSNDAVLPFLAVGYNNKVASTAFGFGAGYGTYEKAAGMDADTYYLYGQVEQKIAAAKLVAKLYYGQNMGEIPGYEGPAAAYNATTDEDASTVAGFVAGEFKVTDKVKIQGGVGYAVSDSDDYTDKDQQIAYYVQAPITIAKGFTVTPNITLYDFMDDQNGANQGNELWAGCQWRFDL